MSYVVDHLSAIEILDSRGRPTLMAMATVNGRPARASVPSGASTGVSEARELRDGDPARYGGLGCLRAVANVCGKIARAVVGRAFASQTEFDESLIELDGTADKSRLGSNAILAASVAFARATAIADGVPLYVQLSQIAGASPARPQLTVNLFSGGKHAGGQVEVQDVLLVPVGVPSTAVALERVVAVVAEAKKLVARKYRERPLKADEGGLAPAFTSVEEMFQDAVDCIERAGLKAGRDMALAIDVASSHFHADRGYRIGDDQLTTAGMIERVSSWVGRWPIISVEDGLSETDWSGWPTLKQTLAGRAMVLGDDLLCTNPGIIRRAIAERACDALLLKVNQIGTLTEARESLRLAREAGWRVVVSARSGETEDDWLADLATGWAADQIKVGSIQQSERLAKYNRLLAIESGC